MDGKLAILNGAKPTHNQHNVRGSNMTHKYVYLFKEGNAGMKDLLGGKGANLAEMTALGLPVPQGFTRPSGISYPSGRSSSCW